MIYIEQPAFLPWLGFCEALLVCDEVALLDGVQFTEGGWQNRNRIKGPNGVTWLTVPVEKHYKQLLRDVRISREFNPQKILESIRHAYKRTQFYGEATDVIAHAIERNDRWLVDLNVSLISAISCALGASVDLTSTSTLVEESNGALERIASICGSTGNNVLWAGEGTRGYLDVDALGAEGVSVMWNEFPSRHPVYRQNWNAQGFVSGLSIIDSACNIGWAGTAAMLRRCATQYRMANEE
ncbi:WbqC family protein [Nocardia gipuzkoensis]